MTDSRDELCAAGRCCFCGGDGPVVVGPWVTICAICAQAAVDLLAPAAGWSKSDIDQMHNTYKTMKVKK